MPRKSKKKERTSESDQSQTIRHDLKNFLNIIAGNTQLLMMINNDQYTKKYCGEIITNIDKCVQYIDENIKNNSDQT